MARKKTTCVALTPEEFERITEESKKTKASIPELLRMAYFNRLPTRVLMNKKDVVILRKDLNRIGNNLNQITKKINSGLLYGWSDTLEKISHEFSELKKEINLGYGIYKS